MGYSTKDHKESDMTEQLSTHASLFNIFFQVLANAIKQENEKKK